MIRKIKLEIKAFRFSPAAVAYGAALGQRPFQAQGIALVLKKRHRKEAYETHTAIAT